MNQWHPVFAHLLRSVLEDAYDVQTDVPVGDLPRRADIVLIRRLAKAIRTFHGIWRHLSPLNVLEVKGGTESARIRDIALLVEVGLGIARRLRRQMRQQEQKPFANWEISFWYLAATFGKRFPADAEELVGKLDELDPGIYRGRLLGHPILFVRGRTVPLDYESIPIHLISEENIQGERAVAKVIVSEPDWWAKFSIWLLMLHPRVWEEVVEMARKQGHKGLPDFKGFAEKLGIKRFVDEIGEERVFELLNHKKFIQKLGPKRVVSAIGYDEFVAGLTTVQLEELRHRIK